MTVPYAEPLTPLSPAPRVVPEPPRAGEAGRPCRICNSGTTEAVWGDEHFTLHPPRACSLPGTVWIASREHVDSFADLPPAAAADFAGVVASAERAMLDRDGEVARVHLYRWGDGGAHFHVWLMPRPLGMLEATGAMLPLWEDVLPNAPDEECLAAAREVADRMP